MSTVNKFYKKFEPFIKGYTSKIEITDNSIELCDIEQELKIKLYTSIIAYGKKWGHWRKTGKLKPIPIEFYIKTVLNNKMIDLYKSAKSRNTNRIINCNSCGSASVKKIGVLRLYENKQKVFEYKCDKCDHKFTPEQAKNDHISKEFDNLDMGYEPIMSNINFQQKVIVIEGYDFLSGMNKTEKACMCMFFKGYDKNKIAKVFKRHFVEGYNGVLIFISDTIEAYRINSEINQISMEISNKLTFTYAKNSSSED